MITALILAATAFQDAEVSAPQLVSKMLATYSGKKSMVGKIRFVQSVANISVSVDTAFQYELPSRIYIRQVRQSSDPASSLLSGDGKYFSYDVPRESVERQGAKRLIETVAQSGRNLTVQEIYAASASSLLDRSVPLDIAIGRLEDLKFARNQWATLEFVKSSNPEGLAAVGGQWRPYGSAPLAGSYEMWISPEGDLRRYVLRETISVVGQPPQAVTSDWQISISPDGKPDPSLFRLVR